MPDIYSVVVLEEWIEPVTPYLEHLTCSETSESKGIARQCLEEFALITNTMEVMKTNWAQGSFSTKQMHLIKLITTYLDMEMAQRRFSV